MPMFRRVSLLLFAVASCFVISITADAQATRTWVSGVGDDVNPCSRTAPCKTFAGAIAKTAERGEINCLDSAGYGSLNITKSITIDCSGIFGSILAPTNTTGVTINAPAGIVRLRGLSINGAGTGTDGIRIMGGNQKVFIENVVIDGFTVCGIAIANGSPLRMAITNTTVRNNSMVGILSNGTGTAEIVVTGSTISGNVNGIIAASAGTTLRLSASSVSLNTTGLSTSAGGKILSYGNNLIDGNGTNGSPTSTASLK